MPKIEVQGRPVPKSLGKTGKRVYTPNKVSAQEEKIGMLWNYKIGKYWPDAKLAFCLQAIYSDERHADLKNLIYLAEDALSEVAYADDKQIITYEPSPEILISKKRREKTVIWVSAVKETEYGFKEVKDE